jgi:hypothetical protein
MDNELEPMHKERVINNRRYCYGICSQELKKTGIIPGRTSGVMADITAMQVSKQHYCISQLSQSRHSNILPPESEMSDINPSVL